MSNGANSIHKQLRSELEYYIKAQYFGRSPLLLSAVEDRLDDEGLLYQKPYIESSPVYESSANGIQGLKLPDWQKSFFLQLSKAGLGVHPTPFVHQTDALQAAADGRDVFVSTGTGSGKTECFMWPLMAKLACEAKNSPDSWPLMAQNTAFFTFSPWGRRTFISFIKAAEPTSTSSPRISADKPTPS